MLASIPGTRPWGSATPPPSAVLPSRSRLTRLSKISPAVRSFSALASSLLRISSTCFLPRASTLRARARLSRACRLMTVVPVPAQARRLLLASRAW
jgi:hypothetical protein